MEAAMRSNDAVASAMLQAGADVHAVCDWQRTALHWAAETNSAVVPLLLAAGASAAAVCADGALPLHLACREFGTGSTQVR
jgi:ankyrin repeat protein